MKATVTCAAGRPLAQKTGCRLQNFYYSLLIGHLHRFNALITAISSVVGPETRPRSMRAWITQRRPDSGVAIPNDRATSVTDRPRSNTSSTARRRNSDVYFDGRAITAVSLPVALQPQYGHCIKPGATHTTL